ncbi:hypothetical protein IWQ62_000669 [Dispira parvispora]|uniref:Uncharacterized protein n=1 Tax=Dispira parvispora TaxID=1520584 RepID=A0A9W8E4R3_9FUNG|nr:hypothetical protein IWQ62_000669 [Dispira parvispora]
MNWDAIPSQDESTPKRPATRRVTEEIHNFLHRVQHTGSSGSPSLSRGNSTRSRHRPPPRSALRQRIITAYKKYTCTDTQRFLQAVADEDLPTVLRFLFPTLGRQTSAGVGHSDTAVGTPPVPKFEELTPEGYSLSSNLSDPGTSPNWDPTHTPISPNVCDESQRTALHIAASKGNVAMILMLIRAGADVNTRDVLGNTPLHIAVVSNYINCVLALLQAGADITASNGSRNPVTPLDLARNRLRSIRTHERSILGCWDQEDGKKLPSPTKGDEVPPGWSNVRHDFHRVVSNIKEIIQILQFYASRTAPGHPPHSGVNAPFNAPSATSLVLRQPPQFTLNATGLSPSEPSDHRIIASELDQLLGKLTNLDLDNPLVSRSDIAAIPNLPNSGSSETRTPTDSMLVTTSHARRAVPGGTGEKEMDEILDRLEKLLCDL